MFDVVYVPSGSLGEETQTHAMKTRLHACAFSIHFELVHGGPCGINRAVPLKPASKLGVPLRKWLCKRRSCLA